MVNPLDSGALSRLTDVRAAWRALCSRPAYALIATVTIALVVGAGSAVLAVISATFLRPLPFADESRLVSLFALPPGSRAVLGGTPLFSPAFVRMGEGMRSVESVVGIWSRDRALTRGGEVEMIATAGVSPGYFQVLGIELSAGRMFTGAEDTAAAKVAVISSGFARSRMGADAPLGGRLMIDGEEFDVVGVLPPVFEPEFVGAEIFTPLSIHRGNQPVPSSTIVRAVARLRPGATPDQARAEVESVMRGVVDEHPVALKGWSAGAVSIREGMFGDARPALTLLFLAICLLTLIACANLATLTLAEMSGRHDEITLRSALGASRVEIVRQLAMEQVLVAFTGGAAGLLAARAFLPAILALDSGAAESLGVVTIDWRVQFGALVLSLFVSVISGVLPALSATRGDLAQGLAQSSRRTAGSQRQARTRGWLVTIETMIASVLLVTSALLLSTFGKTSALEPGFDPSNVLAAQMGLPVARYPGPAERAAFVKRVVEEVRAVPGVVSASAGFNRFQPGSGFLTSVVVDGRPTADGQPRTLQFRRASPGYFETMKIREIRGRTFADSDVGDSLPVTVISQQLALEVWPGEDPIGRRLARSADPTRLMTVIGVVDDVRDRGLEQPTAPTFYLPYSQNSNPAAQITLLVRTASEPGGYRRAITQAVHRVDPGLPLSGVTTLEEFMASSLGPGRFRSVLLLAFAGLGLVLAVVGIYGVTSRGVGERTRELGIRVALGSGRTALSRLVLGQALGAVGVGIAAGVPAAILAGLLVSRSVPGTSMADLWGALPSVLVLVVAGGVAAALPALRATRIDPVIALRTE